MTELRADKLSDIAGARRRLLAWYGLHKRDLPWRRTSDPYRIWISEIMLQQTRVEAVIPYYENFLRAFPSVAHLARAREERVLAAWSGLGYYSRARNLRRAAQAIQTRHDGQFPRDEQAALELPGVGGYTSAAILSIAYGAPLAVLDGNVARVLSRLHTVKAEVREKTGREALWSMAREFLDARHAGDFNQAMMELGATVCLPRQPRCEICPLRKDCQANAQNVTAEYPPARERARETIMKLIGAAVQDHAGRYLLEQRPPASAWLAGFWEFPMWRAPEHDGENIHGDSPLKDRLKLLRPLGKFRHSITQFRIEVDLREAVVATEKNGKNGKGIRETRFRRWADLATIRKMPATTITRKALALIGAAAQK